MDSGITLAVIALVGTLFTAWMMYRSAYAVRSETRVQEDEREANTESVLQKTYGEILREVRATLAIREKKIIDLGDELALERRKRYEILKERDTYAAHDLKLQRLLKKHAPRVDIPMIEINGNSTPPKERRKNE